MGKRKYKKRETPVRYLHKAKCRMCEEGEMSSYLEKLAEALSAETEQKLQEEEESRKKQLEEFFRISEEIEEEVKEAMDFHRELYAIVPKSHSGKKKKAYIITFKDHPSYSCMVFSEDKDKARTAGQRAIRDMFFPMYSLTKCPIKLFETKCKRCEELDKYVPNGRAPIPNILKAGIQLECNACHTGCYTYHDFMTKRCYVIEGEGDPIPFASGVLLCRDCYNRFCS